MMSSVREAFEILRNQICSTHVHDNDKDKDLHLWPGQGTIDWKEAVELLRSAPQKPPLLLELGEDEKVNALEKLAETFDKLEATT
jgi:sugar phosphate isomerase/epimerase